MEHYNEQHKLALLSCLEVVLMSMGNTKYNLLVTKLDSLYRCTVRDCYEHPEYLKPVLKELYKEDYDSIIENIKGQLEDISATDDLAGFFKIMES